MKWRMKSKRYLGRVQRQRRELRISAYSDQPFHWVRGCKYTKNISMIGSHSSRRTYVFVCCRGSSLPRCQSARTSCPPCGPRDASHRRRGRAGPPSSRAAAGGATERWRGVRSGIPRYRSPAWSVSYTYIVVLVIATRSVAAQKAPFSDKIFYLNVKRLRGWNIIQIGVT